MFPLIGFVTGLLQGQSGQAVKELHKLQEVEWLLKTSYVVADEYYAHCL